MSYAEDEQFDMKVELAIQLENENQPLKTFLVVGLFFFLDCQPSNYDTETSY